MKGLRNKEISSNETLMSIYELDTYGVKRIDIFPSLLSWIQCPYNILLVFSFVSRVNLVMDSLSFKNYLYYYYYYYCILLSLPDLLRIYKG